jgi:Uma2 family endonuclease
MTPIAAGTPVSLEEYLRTCYEPDAEYVCGHLVERNVGEWSHSLLHSLIVEVLSLRRRDRGSRIFSEQRVRVTDEPRYRVPDICVVPVSHPYERVLTKPPHLAIEIRSPEDEVADVLAKIGEYLDMGIPHVWFVDPYKRRILEADGQGIREPAGRLVETELVGRVDFNLLFAQLDETIHRDSEESA